MNTEQKINKIYEVIADKQIRLGTFIKSDSILYQASNEPIYNIIHTTAGVCFNQKDIEVVGLPVMLGDVIDYWFSHGGSNSFVLLKQWTLPRLSIDQQSEECIDFVFGLCK